MENVDLNALVDKISDKVGLAVEKVQPIAEETVRQYQTEQFFYSMCGLGFLIVCICISIICVIGAVNTTRDSDGYYAGAMGMGFLGISIGGAISMCAYGAYLAPLPHLLGL